MDLHPEDARLTEPQREAAHVRQQIMHAVQAVDDLRLLSVWLGAATNREMSPIEKEFMDHLAVIPDELSDLKDLYIIHFRKLTMKQVDSPDRVST